MIHLIKIGKLQINVCKIQVKPLKLRFVEFKLSSLDSEFSQNIGILQKSSP